MTIFILVILVTWLMVYTRNDRYFEIFYIDILNLSINIFIIYEYTIKIYICGIIYNMT